jgi:hypothetical protein
MLNEAQKKQIVREKYSEIAQQDKALNASSCCGATNSSKEVYNIMMDDILNRYLDATGIAAFKAGKTGIFSITVYGEKPGAAKPKIKVNMADMAAGANACKPQSGCC